MAPPTPPARRPRRLSPLFLGGGLLVAALGFGLPQILPAPADPAPAPSLRESTDAAATDAPPLGPALARLAACLVLVCGLCVGVTRLVNRKAAAAGGPMKPVACLRVNARCVVHLVQAGDRRLLVGTDAAGVKALVELPATGAPAPHTEVGP